MFVCLFFYCTFVQSFSCRRKLQDGCHCQILYWLQRYRLLPKCNHLDFCFFLSLGFTWPNWYECMMRLFWNLRSPTRLNLPHPICTFLCVTHDDEEHVLKTLCVHAKIKHSMADHLITQNEEKEEMSRGRTTKALQRQAHLFSMRSPVFLLRSAFKNRSRS